MKKNPKTLKEEINLGPDYINIKASTIVKLSEEFVVFTQEGPITLTVDIHADFADIPENYHEIFFNVLTSKYLNKVSYGQNSFSKCNPIVKKKWWEFWKKDYSIKN
jgi:hypothetical protein